MFKYSYQELGLPGVREVEGAWISETPISLFDDFSAARRVGNQNATAALAVLQELPPTDAIGMYQLIPSMRVFSVATVAKTTAPLGPVATPIPSVKNFALGLTLPSSYDHRAAVVAAVGGAAKASAAQSVVLLAQSKIDKDTYYVNFSQPLSAYQAFGVALSRFETAPLK